MKKYESPEILLVAELDALRTSGDSEGNEAGNVNIPISWNF